jgi:hypothetical protein
LNPILNCLYLGELSNLLDMKKALLFSLVVLGITSCSKDSLDASVDSFNKPVKSEIMVQVTYLSWSNHSGGACGNTGNEEVAYMSNVKVALYHGQQILSDGLGIPVMNSTTDSKGSALLQDIEPDMYTVSVETPLGTKSRTITAQLHKRSYVDFSF